MGKDTGFLEYARELAPRRPVTQRVNDWFEIYLDFPEEKLRTQGARCMDCGVPFCQTGCPVNNLIPDWNDLVYRGRWREAVRQLHATNNFPEFTGRICPAPCEASCVLGINQPAVTIKQIEKHIVERGFAEGWIHPEPSKIRTGKKVAIVGSGPAGLAAAQQLCRAGHTVVVYEKADRIGGLLVYGIPQFKMEKRIVDRRVEQMSAEGVKFVTNAEVGKNVAVEDLQRDFDAIVVAGGAEHPRDLNLPGRELKGIHFAMEFLPQQNRRSLGDKIEPHKEILATGKHVVIIGGGDTGADCLGTCHRQKPLSVHQFEIMPKPPEERSPLTPWPLWPMQLRIEGAHEEGGARDWSIATTKFTGSSNGCVQQLHAVQVGPPPQFEPIASSEFTLEADLVLIAMGFLGPVRNGMIEQLALKLDVRGNVATDGNYMSSVPGIFAAGDMRRGQSLVVWAIAEGRKAAASVDAYLRTQAVPLAAQPVSAEQRITS
ncbi:MAG TPA: glutamate synthase subunit beta [Terriglobales bacterium]|jgi:glutamate synthase (NADPH/NADH) small chain|nr:glutamate synthase subunit beta [Terriglobales bacterium]